MIPREKVEQALELWTTTGMNQRQIGQRLGLRHETISHIIRREAKKKMEEQMKKGVTP